MINKKVLIQPNNTNVKINICNNNKPVGIKILPSGEDNVPHNNLEGLQGGDPILNEYYHLSEDDFNTVSNQYIPDGIQNGGLVTWSGTGFTYDIGFTFFRLGQQNYIQGAGQVTLEDAPGTAGHKRIDSIYVNQNGYFVATGVPSENPIIAQIPVDSLLLTSILIEYGQTQPGGIINENIYQENIEWTGSADGVYSSVNFDNIDYPYSGAKAIQGIDFRGGSSILMTRGTTFNPLDYSTISFKLRLGSQVFGSFKYIFLLRFETESGQQTMPDIPLVASLQTLNEYQMVVAEITDSVVTTSNIGDTIRVRLIFSGAPTVDYKLFHIDDWKLQGGIDQPSPSSVHNQLQGLQGGDAELDEYIHLTRREYDNLSNQYQPDGLLRGGVVDWTGVGYGFDISSAEIRLGGIFYLIFSDTIILDAPDDTHNRFDLFYVTANGFGVKKGEPSANPLIPQVDDASLQIPLTPILVETGTTEPGGISSEAIYLENLEWSGSSSGFGTFNFDSTVNPRTDTKSIQATGVGNNSTILMNRGSDFLIHDFDSIGFWMWMNQGLNLRRDSFFIGFTNSTGNKITTPIELLVPDIKESWVFISIPTSVFENVLARSVYVTLKTQGNSKEQKEFFIDDWRIQGGVSQPGPVTEHDALLGIKGNGTFHLSETERDWLHPTIFEGVAIPLSNPIRGAHKEAVSTAAVYNIAETPAPVTGGWAKYKINVSQATLDSATLTEPEITDCTKIAGSDFVVDTDMYIIVEKTISGAVEYWFAQIAEA